MIMISKLFWLWWWKGETKDFLYDRQRKSASLIFDNQHWDSNCESGGPWVMTSSRQSLIHGFIIFSSYFLWGFLPSSCKEAFHSLFTYLFYSVFFPLIKACYYALASWSFHMLLEANNSSSRGLMCQEGSCSHEFFWCVFGDRWVEKSVSDFVLE